MPSPQFRVFHVRALSGWRALLVGGFVLALLAALAFVTFGLFLLLLPVAAALGLASLFFRKTPRPHSIDPARTGGPDVIEGEYKVISEEKIALDAKQAPKEEP